MPRILVDVTHVDMTTTVLGVKVTTTTSTLSAAYLHQLTIARLF
jgi:hypothetical protein